MIIKPVNNAPLLSKVSGLLGISKENVLYVSPKSGGVVFVLEGVKAKEMEKLAGRAVTVFGAMKVPAPTAIDGVRVKYNIEVSTYSMDTSPENG